METADHSVNENYNGSSDIGFTGLGDSQAIVIDESVDGKDYIMTYIPRLPRLQILPHDLQALAPKQIVKQTAVAIVQHRQAQ